MRSITRKQYARYYGGSILEPFNPEQYTHEAAQIVDLALWAGVALDDGNVVDLLLDNMPELRGSGQARRVILADSVLALMFPVAAAGGREPQV